MSNVILGLIVAIAILALGNFVLHIAEGGGRLILFLVAIIAFVLCAFGPGNIWGRKA